MAKFARKKRSAIALQSVASIDYSVTMRRNPMNENDPSKAYASVQYAGTAKLDQLAQHILDHGSPYTRDMIIGVATALVDCVREHVLEGYKVELGDLGTFKITISNKGAKSLDEFKAETNIDDALVEYEPGGYFVDLKDRIQWNQVVNRTIQRAAMRAFKAGRITQSQMELIRKGRLELAAVAPDDAPTPTGGGDDGGGSGDGD